MQKTLIDSGPFIALFDASDKFHNDVVEFMANFKGELLTTWAVITEVSYMLSFNLTVQIDFLKWLERGGLNIYEISQDEVLNIRVMMEKYIDVPMDLADSSLVYVACKEQIKQVISIDSDFDIYRVCGGEFENLLLSYIKK